MNQTAIKQYILELLEENEKEIDYLIQRFGDKNYDDDDPRFVRIFTINSLLKRILRVINKLEAESNGI